MPEDSALAAMRTVQAHDLPRRWAGQQRFAMLATGFDQGLSFLAAWAAWRADARRCERLYFLAGVHTPVSAPDLRQALAHCPWPDLADALLAQWPPLTRDVHSLAFDHGRVHLFLAVADPRQALRQWVARVDAFLLDSDIAPPSPEATPRALEAALQPLARLAAVGATLTAPAALAHGPATLARLGFDPQPGDSARLLARFAPRHPVGPPPGRQALQGARRIAVVGAGLAGSFAASALARQGLEVVVFDELAPAQGASGNPAGLYHPVLHAADSLQARWFRTCALHAHRRFYSGHEPGPGMLRLEGRLSWRQMQALLQRLALPETFVQALSSAQASALAGVHLPGPAWWFASAGAVSPAAQVAAALQQPGITVHHNRVRALARTAADAGTDTGWSLYDDQGRSLLHADGVVLANAADALRLAGHAAWPQELLRGQVTWIPGANDLGLPLPALPVGGDGYALAVNGALLCGATQQAEDRDARVRDEDHRHNLQRAARLLGGAWPELADLLPHCQGRTGWRVAVPGRLPVIGHLPAPAGGADGTRPPRSDAPRLIPRQQGLYVLTALGSRGLTQAPLAGEILAAWITGAPQPVPARLLDAVDVARLALQAGSPQAP